MEIVPSRLGGRCRKSGVADEPIYHRGRKLVFSIMVADVPWDPNDIDTLIQVITDVANLSVAIYEAY